MPLSASLDAGGDGPSFVDLMAADGPGPEALVDAAELAERVRRAVDDLPEHFREVLVLGYFEQMAYKEVAEALGIPLGTVKSRMHAAVAALARVWGPQTGRGSEPSREDQDR